MPVTRSTVDVKLDTSWNRFWERLDACVDEDVDGPHKGLGRMIIRGLKETEDRDEEEEEVGEEEVEPELKKDKALYTDEEMNYMRFIIVTQRPSDELDSMRKLLLCEQADTPGVMLNTRFSYHVIGSLKLLQRQLRQCKDNWGCKFDKLLCYTHT